MLKKIAAGQLRPGMYVHELDAGWLDHPFVRSRFAVISDTEVERVIAAGIREVYIDTDRGADVPDAPTEAEVRAELDQAMVAVAVAPAQAPAAASAPAALAAATDAAAAAAAMLRVPASEEFDRARHVLGQATTIVRSLMNDVRLGNQVQIEQVGHVVSRMSESILRNSNALLALTRVKNKDNYTFIHSVSVGALLIAFCRYRQFDAAMIHDAGIGGMLHDIGKVRVANAILNKPGRLTDAEFVSMKRHVVESRRILMDIEGVSPVAVAVAAQHHERYDGSGYPENLAGDGITPIGQMAAICDVYDAITSDRVYHKGMPPSEAVRKIFEWSKFHFNPTLVQMFVRCIGIYPVGSLVMLESGVLAVVVDQQEGKLLQPQVRVVFDTNANCYLPPKDLDLARPGCADHIVSREIDERWGIDPAQFL